MFKFLTLIAFLCLAATVFGQISLEGTCSLQSTQAVAPQNLVGEWKQLKRINETGSVDGRCLTLNFAYNATTGEAGITTTSVANRQLVTRNATIVIKQANILTITYTDGITYDMVIKATDYVNYVILHGCTENNNTKSVYGQVYTRNTVVSSATNTTINTVLATITDFANASWVVSSHSAEECETDSGVNLQVSSLLLLLVGLVLAKDI